MIFLYFLLVSFVVNAQTDSLAVQVDSSLVEADSSMIVPAKIADTLVVFSSLPLSLTSTFISSEKILFSDYRYAADYFSSFPFSFQRSFGSYGQPNEVIIYGNEFLATTVLRNGIDFTNAYAFSKIFDFNFIQSEDVDSVEIIRAPRSFLFGFETNKAAVNFISKDIVSNYPYTRIKYYEGNFGEAMLDFRAGIFLYKKLNLNFDITNRKQEDSYRRTTFSHWMGKVGLKYYASSLFNFYAEYFYSRKITDLNGGVNVDSIKKYSSDVNKILYNYISAPVLYMERYEKDFRNNFQVGSMFQLGNYRGEINFTAREERREWRVNEKDTLTSRLIDLDYSSKIFTLNSNYRIIPELLSANLNLQSIEYENESVFTTVENGIEDQSKINKIANTITSNITGELLSGAFTSSIFLRYSTSGGSNYSGYGADLNFRASENISFYAGYSSYQLSNGVYYNAVEFPRTNSFETELKLKYLQFDFMLGMYYMAYRNLYFANYPAEWNTPLSLRPLPNRLISDLGLSAKLIFPIWKIWFEGFITRTGKTYNQGNESEKTISFNPNLSLHSTVNIFYRDSLFTNDLELQTGFTFRYFKSNWLAYYENFTNRSYYVQPEAKNDYQIDFVASGRIQKTAIVYFAWENLLDREYYMYAYYPMYRRGIRFGLAWEFLN